MKHVLITRPEPGASETADRVSALGFVPVVAPVFSIIAREINVPERVAATLLTSRNAVPACPPWLYNRTAYGVGAATAAQATEAGFTKVLSADGDAEALAALVAGTQSPTSGTLFFPAAQGQGTELVSSLRRQGFKVVRRVAYQAAPVQNLPELGATHLQRGQLTAAMFFSTETARHFVRLLHAARLTDSVRNVAAVAISDRASVALSTLPWRRISVAPKPNQEAMLVLLNE